MTTVYRVYEPFHDSAESGAIEYGVYSNLKKALERVKEVWGKNNYPAVEDESEYGWYVYFQMDTYNIRISHIVLDKDTDDKSVGYT